MYIQSIMRMMVDVRVALACLLLLVHYSSKAHGVGNTSVTCRDNERASLLSFKHDVVDIYGGLSLSSWENHTDCCQWQSVHCDETGHVVELNLGDEALSLKGKISPSLAELHYLTSLDLGGHYFNAAQFPTFILSLKRLEYLNLSYTNLRGNIPLQLGNSLPNLQTLDLSGNQLEGAIPKSLALCSLTYLSLQENSLSGQLDDFIASFSYCSNVSLQTLDLSHNRLTGALPNVLHFPFLEYFFLYNNQLNGTLTHSIGLLSNLKMLDISHNLLQGVISETHFLRLNQLFLLSLSFNDLTFNISHDWIPPFQLNYIGLASCKLGPDIPRWLQTQQQCVCLDISYNEISGTIPTWFSDFICDGLMDLSHNQISGEMLDFPFQPTSFIDLSSNLFEGSIPLNSLYSADISLDLSSNKFTDAAALLCPNVLVTLKVLDISNNQILGVLPNCWVNFLELVILDVSNNSFYGNIPPSIGSLIYLQSLHLGYNRFYGEIPLSLTNCTELVTFDGVQNNFSGLIPDWIGYGLKKLRVLILRSNKFFGSLPPNICHLPQLQILDLSMNNISGGLPKCLNHLSAMVNQTNFDATISYSAITNGGNPPSPIEDVSLVWKGKVFDYRSTLGLVKSIDLSSNMLEGEIPSELMDLNGLVSLNISRNMLSGQIPATIGQMKLLDFLDLSRNNLSGHIPSQLSQIDRLGVMDLSHNNLSGEIPHGTQLQSFNPSTYEGNALCGAPLPKCPTRPHPNDNDVEEDDPFFSKGLIISLCMGFFTGYCGICSLIFFNKSFRYAYFRLVRDIYDKAYVFFALNVAKLRR